MVNSDKGSAPRRLSRLEWIDAALSALGQGGVDALRVEPLAKSLRVTKGSFYWHFADRQELRRAVLQRWEEVATGQIIDQVESSPSDGAGVKLRALMELTFRSDPSGDAVESAVRAWAQQDDEAAAVAGKVDRRRLIYVATLLRQAGLPAKLARRRARLLYRTLIGEFAWRSAGGPSSTKLELDDLANLLLAPD